MNAHASPLLADTSLAGVLAALAGHDAKPLLIAYHGRMAEAGYHITEVKAGSFVTLDCGSNADAWQETILQVEDAPATKSDRPMTVRKFRGILGEVDRKVRLNADARLTIEIGRPREPMQVFDVATVDVADDAATLRLGARPAICQPRHRAAREVAGSACCGSTASGCC